jgi:tripartite-type tricarboxylate transporter receptor subunit TctC
MIMPLTRVLSAALLALVTAVMTTGGMAASYPAKPVSLIVPFAPGGRTDITARIVAQQLGKYLGATVVVVNKPGAGGVIGSKDVANAAPDGYTLGFFSTAIVTSQYTVSTPTDLADYAAIGVMNVDPAALAVRADAPWKTLAELADYGRKNAGKLQFGMAPGASGQIFAAGFVKAARMQPNYVPFKGDADGAIALAGGHVDVHVAVPVAYKALAEAGKVRILAVASDARSPMYPAIPTFRENGVDLVIGSFHALFAPKATPPEVISTLAAALEKTMKDKATVDQMTNAGLGALYLNPAATATYIKQQDALYRSLIQDLGMMVAKK